MIQSGVRTSTKADHLRLTLTEMEAKAGMVPLDNFPENFRTQTSLIHFQEVLSDSELFLSYFLGDRESYAWAVTRKSVSLYRLPPAMQVRAEVDVFRDAVRDSRGDAKALGSNLYGELIGNLATGESRKPHWLLSLGDSLLDLPFSALVTADKKAKYLIEMHSLQIVPGATLLSGAPGLPNRAGWMLRVGDPVYNRADGRRRSNLAVRLRDGWRAPGPMTSPQGWFERGGSSIERAEPWPPSRAVRHQSPANFASRRLRDCSSSRETSPGRAGAPR